MNYENFYKEHIKGPHKRIGDELVCRCPFTNHSEDDKKPAFYVNIKDGRHHCFKCEASGNIYTFCKEKGIPVPSEFQNPNYIPPEPKTLKEEWQEIATELRRMADGDDQPKPFTRIKVSEIRAHKPKGEVQYWGPIFERGHSLGLVGKPGDYKTIFTLNACLAMANGGPGKTWLEYPTPQSCRILYILKEGVIKDLMTWFNLILDNNPDWEDNQDRVEFVEMSEARMFLLNKENIERVRSTFLENPQDPYHVVILDPWSLSITEDEQSNRETNQAFQKLSAIQADFPTVNFWLNHHSPHDYFGHMRKGPSAGRGASAFGQNLTTLLVFERPYEDRQRILLSYGKVRPIRQPDDHDLIVDDNLRFTAVPKQGKKKRAFDAKIVAQMAEDWETIEHEHPGLTELSTALASCYEGLGVNRARELVNKAERFGLIEILPGKTKRVRPSSSFISDRVGQPDSLLEEFIHKRNKTLD